MLYVLFFLWSPLPNVFFPKSEKVSGKPFSTVSTSRFESGSDPPPKKKYEKKRFASTSSWDRTCVRNEKQVSASEIREESSYLGCREERDEGEQKETRKEEGNTSGSSKHDEITES